MTTKPNQHGIAHFAAVIVQAADVHEGAWLDPVKVLLSKLILHTRVISRF